LIFSQDLCLEYLIDGLDMLLVKFHLHWAWFTSILIRFVDSQTFLVLSGHFINVRPFDAAIVGPSDV